MFRSKTCLGLLAFSVVGVATAAPDPGVGFFETKIRPVLVDNCYECHSVEAANRGKLKAGLFLDSRDGIRQGGDSGPAAVPGNVDDSLLIGALRQQGPEMPPSGALADPVISDFVRWIEEGAVDPRDEPPAKLEKTDKVEARDHWAFQPMKAPEPPAVSMENWISTEVDRFILHRLEAEEIKPVERASTRSLVRRIYFDLVGLPPTPGQVDEFVDAASQDRQAAVGGLIDRLLESPHYGERWGRHWLDVARYAEDQAHTFGVKKRENAHQYRDWVIRMFNEDLPFDQFIKRQLAGDLIETPEQDRFSQLSGLGFLGLGAQYYKNSDKAKAEADELDDTIDTVTRGFMGLTVSCARCHDHKFDPVTIEDYYALAGIFNGRRYSEVALAPEEVVKAYNEEQKVIKDRESENRSQLRAIGKQVGRQHLPQLGVYLKEGWRLAVLKSNGVNVPLEEYSKKKGLHSYYLNRFRDYLDPNRKNDLLKRLPEMKGWHEVQVEFEGKPSPESVEIPAPIVSLADQMERLVSKAAEAFSKAEADHREAFAGVRNEEDRLNKVMGKVDKEAQRLLKHVWFDGHAPFFAGEKEVNDHFLNDEEKAEADLRKKELDEMRKNATPKYPVAHAIQGGGRAMQVYLRGDPANKGDWVARSNLEILAGEPRPGDPEAAKEHSYSRLDLANDIASPANPLTARVIVNRVWQWHFGEGLVTTASNFGVLGDSPSHPELLDWLTTNFIKEGWSLKWLHRQIMNSSTYQLSSRRDSLNEQRDPDNRLRWQFARRRLEVEAWRDALLAVSGQLDLAMGGPTLELKPGNRRRTVYASISRHQLDGMLRIFDFPDANVSAAARTETTVPQQQLFVLNSTFMIEQAKAFAKRVAGESDDRGGQLDLAYRLAFGRPPSNEELEVAMAFLSSEGLKDDKLTRWEQYCQALLASNEFMYLD